MTKCKRKLLKIGIICLMPLFALLLCLNNTYAWYIDDNNNMTSSNLFNYNDILSGKEFSGTDVVDNPDWFVSGYIPIEPYTSYYLSGKTSGQSFITYDNNKTVVRNLSLVNGLFNSTNNEYFVRFNAPLSDLNTIMFNEGSTALAYEPYGFSYINPNNIDLMQYLIGNNYFSHGRVMAYQTSDGNYWDRHLYPTNELNVTDINELTINQYINGNVLNLGTLCVDLLNDLSTKSYYSTSNATFIALKPALAINGVATYPPVECRYIDLYIYCPNSLAVASCLIGGSGDIDYNNHQRVEFRKEGDYIHIYFDEDNYNYIWDIDMRIDYSNGWVFPQTARCDLEGNPNFNMYDLGVESGYQKGVIEGKQLGYNQGKIDGYNSGYERGKQAGYNEGISSNLETNGFKTLLNSIISYPINLVKNSLDFNFMGINVAQIVMFIISLGIVAFVIQKFKE